MLNNYILLYEIEEDFLFNLPGFSMKGKQLSKSVYKQIHEEPCFSRELEFLGDCILGYINEPEPYGEKYHITLIWLKYNSTEYRKTILQKLKKYNDFEPQFGRRRTDLNTFDNMAGIFLKDNSYSEERLTNEELNKRDFKEHELISKEYKNLLDSLSGHQIYLK